MNWLKPMMLMVVLGAILYGVYVVLNKGPAPEPPPGVNRDWAKAPDIQLGVVEDDKGGPGGMPITRPGDRMAAAGSNSFAPPYSAGPPTSETRSAVTGNQGSAPNPSGPTAPDDPFRHGDASKSLGTPAGQATPWADAPRNDSANTASPVFSSPRDPAGIATPGDRTDGANAAPRSQESFTDAVEIAKGMLGEGKLVEALRKLTKWYNNPQLSSEESRQLNELLSQLAGTVIYSRQHLLQPAYKVRSGDRLETIAAQYNVPWQLLAKINGIDDPNQLRPGDELKVVRGPFSATVDLDKRQLTLTVEECYAGRFNLVAVGDLARNLEGSFQVGDKTLDGRPGNSDGTAHTPSSPIHHWVGLGNNMWIVGTSDPASIHPGGLNLNSRDAEDVYDILSMGSRVTVRR